MGLNVMLPSQAGTAMYLFPLPGSGITHGKKARPDAGKYAIATVISLKKVVSLFHLF